MKKKLSIFAASIFMLTLFTQCELFKVKVLHKGKVITVSKNAADTHVAHGDEIISGIYKQDDGTLIELPYIPE